MVQELDIHKITTTLICKRKINMKKFLICLILLLIVAFGNAQIVTNCTSNPGTSNDGSHKWDVVKVEIYPDYTLVQFEITAIKPIRRLNIYDNLGHLVYGDENKDEYLTLRGGYFDGAIKYLGINSEWGWNKVGAREQRLYTLYFANGPKSKTIPPGITSISIYGIGVEADDKRTTWRSTNMSINNPRKHYTNYSSEYSIKQYLDANNDGICGIYEVMGNNAGSKFACIKYNGEYVLIFMSDNLERCWWKMGDIKAYLHRSASGILKADWFMSDKSINKDCYITFDGVFMTVNNVSGSEPGETKYLKMYPTTPPSYNNKKEYTPQGQKQTPQLKQTIPALKKQNVKK